MKIGVSSLSVYTEKIANNLEFIENLKIDYFEILNEYPNTIIDPDHLNSYSLKYTIHSPVLDLNLASLNKNIQKSSIGDIKKSIDLAREIDSEIVVVHPGSLPFLARPFEKKILVKSRESIKICGDYGKDLGVKVAIENMPKIDGFLHQNIFELNELLEKLEMKMTLDVGHAATAGFKENELYFDSVQHIHLSDNDYEFDDHLSLGEGSINFKVIVDLFNKNNYNGIFTIEVNDKESVKKSVKYLKNI